MSENFNLEIVTPDRVIFKSEANQVTIPSFEGLMSILKDHVSIVTFLRPGLIEVLSSKGEEKFFVDEGTVELNNNNLLILSSSVKDVKKISKKEINEMIQNAEKAYNNQEIKDKDKYILSHKIDTLKEFTQ
jgi:F-type H+-transporting ATPase subunit epsilon|tara:strand:- start:503 stop:895 length:393 start_codon:yes stop_codon:yes gene_type:complete